MADIIDKQEYKIDIDALESFADSLVQEKGFKNLDDEVLSQIKKDLVSRLENRINATILATLPPDKLEDFEKILDQGNTEEIQSFCAKQIPDLEQLMASELMSFRQVYLGR